MAHLAVFIAQLAPSNTTDRRSRLITMTESGRRVWNNEEIPRINDYYEQALQDVSVGGLKLLENMKRLDSGAPFPRTSSSSRRDGLLPRFAHTGRFKTHA